MKKLLSKSSIFVLFLLTSVTSIAHAQQDSVLVEKDTTKSEKISKVLEKVFDDGNHNTKKYPRVYGGLTFTRIDWGFSRILENGSFNMSDENKFLSGGRASNFGFDIAQFGVRVSDNFKTYIAAGFEWNYTRLQGNVLLGRKTTPLFIEHIDEDEVKFSKNILTSTYLRLPLAFEWRSKKNRHNERVKVAAGAITGILLKGSQRLKSKENGKQGYRDNYNLASFQYGPFIRIGYDDFAIFGKYYVNDMFEKSPDQKGLNNLTFGLTLGF